MRRLILFVPFLISLAIVAIAEARPQGYAKEQCTSYALERRPDLGVFRAHARDWDNRAREFDFPVVNYPVVGAIVVFEPGVQTANPTYGHVAYVERVLGDGRFVITERGVGRTKLQRERINTRTVHTGPGVSFILRKPAPKLRPPTPKPPTPVPPTEVPPTVVPAGADLKLLQACLDQGYVCLPVPFEITDPVRWYSGYEIEGYRAEYLGFDLDPGTVVTAPFDGLAHDAGQGTFGLTVSLPSGKKLELTFYFAGSAESEFLIPSQAKVAAGDPIARYVGEVQWDFSSGVGPDFEYPGIVQISTGYGGDYPTGIPIYPIAPAKPDAVELMMYADCRGCSYSVSKNDPIAGYNLVIYTAPNDRGFNDPLKKFLVRSLSN